MKKKRDVLFLLQFFYPEYVSSATLPFDTAERLVKDGCSVDVLCGYPREYTDDVKIQRKETVNEIRIRRVKYLQANRKRALGRIVNYLSLTIAMFFRLFSLRKYKAIIVYSNPPILPIIAAWAAKLFGCKLIFVAYDLYPEIAIRTGALSEGGAVTRVMNYINKRVYKRADAVIALSSEMKNFIVDNRKITPDKIHVIPNWFADEYHTHGGENVNSFLHTANGRFAVGYFGNMGVAQDMEPLKAAMKHFKDDPDVCFLVSGHGSKREEIEKLVEDEKIDNVYLYGFLRDQEYLDALRASGCAVVTLESGVTGLCVPSKTYGYMMQGLPVIAIMGESDTVKDVREGAGHHVADNSPDKLIEIIERIKNDPDGCRISGEISRRIYLEKYTPDACLYKYSEVMGKVLSEN